MQHRTIAARKIDIVMLDPFIRAAAARFCTGMSDRAAGETLRKKLLLYRSGAWRRGENLCPTRHRGTINELLWMTLKARDRVPSTMTRTTAWRAASAVLVNVETWLKSGRPGGTALKDFSGECRSWPRARIVCSMPLRTEG
ncbi:MAG TPA: hypothetical protein VI251_15525, partial [Pseudolabrys sp.]